MALQAQMSQRAAATGATHPAARRSLVGVAVLPQQRRRHVLARAGREEPEDEDQGSDGAQAAAALPRSSGALGLSPNALITISGVSSVEELRMVVKEVVDEVLGEVLERQGKKLEAMTAELERRGQLLAALERDTEADAKSLGRAAYAVHDSDRYWPAVLVMGGEDLVDIVSCEGFPADLGAVLDELLAGHCGYLSLRDLLLLWLASEVPSIRSLAAQFGQCGGGPGWWQEERLRLEEVAALLRQQPGAPLPWDQQLEGEDEDGPWWAPFLSTLLAYSEEAGKDGGGGPGGSGGLRRFLQTAQPQPDGRAPVVMMVVALAAGQLRPHLKFGGGPRLAAQGSVLSVQIMEIKTIVKELSQSRQQLQVEGQVLMWLLHVANPSLLAGRQLQLRGTLGMQGKLLSSELREAAQDLEVASCGSTTTMQLEVFSF